MTYDVVAALRACEEACPCRRAKDDDTAVACSLVCDFACLCWKGDRIDPRRIPCLWPGHAAIAAYGEACREAGRHNECQKYHDAEVAAARLAGRVEQAEKMQPSEEPETHLTLMQRLVAERDRLRKEAGK